MHDLVIRSMRRNEVDWAVDLAANEGWNPGLNDAATFFAQDPEGFLVGLLHEAPVCCISAVSYGDSFGFIGFYIVEALHRGKGFGLQIWNAAVERLQGRVIGLDGVPAQQHNYRKSGFDYQYGNIRFEYQPEQAAPPQALSEPLRPLGPHDLAAVVRYEHKLFPAPRDIFLGQWLQMPGAVALGVSNDGDLKGYGVIRPCRVGFKVGPLFANTSAIAEELLYGLCSGVDRQGPVYLDVPEVNEQGMALAARHGMQKVFATARMYRGAPPSLDLGRIFGVTSFELG